MSEIYVVTFCSVDIVNGDHIDTYHYASSFDLALCFIKREAMSFEELDVKEVSDGYWKCTNAYDGFWAISRELVDGDMHGG